MQYSSGLVVAEGRRARLTVVSLALILAACAGTPQARPDEARPVDAPALSPEEEGERQALEQVFRNMFDVPADAEIPARLREPKTVADAQDIVRSDNIALFVKADKVFTEYLKGHPDDVTNLTWHAQLYLAWADSALVTRQSIERSLEQGDGASGITALAEEVISDLDEVSEEKLKVGAEKSLAILKTNQETYEGYRLAADLFRLTKDWGQHDGFIKKLEARNPDSNGLRFLKGVVAYSRDKDYHAAERFLKEAVAKDIKFTKAQYYLALNYLSMRRFDHARVALEQTLAISPGHPFANAMRGYVDRVQKR